MKDKQEVAESHVALAPYGGLPCRQGPGFPCLAARLRSETHEFLEPRLDNMDLSPMVWVEIKVEQLEITAF